MIHSIVQIITWKTYMNIYPVLYFSKVLECDTNPWPFHMPFFLSVCLDYFLSTSLPICQWILLGFFFWVFVCVYLKCNDLGFGIILILPTGTVPWCQEGVFISGTRAVYVNNTIEVFGDMKCIHVWTFFWRGVHVYVCVFQVCVCSSPLQSEKHHVAFQTSWRHSFEILGFSKALVGSDDVHRSVSCPNKNNKK